MKIFYTNSYSGKEQFQEYYNVITQSLHELKAQVISLEVQSYEDLLSTERIENLSKEEIHYLYIRKGMHKSNAVIIEASIDNFQLGHEATLALLLNKPVLCLSQKHDYSIKIKHPKFYARQYSNQSELANIIKEFVGEVKNKHLSVRFNGYLSPEQKNFLEWFGDKNNRNVSEVIRDLIGDKMEEYPEFLEQIVLRDSSNSFT